MVQGAIEVFVGQENHCWFEGFVGYHLDVLVVVFSKIGAGGSR
jgi:hypothetical protein